MNDIKAIKDNHYVDEGLFIESDKKDNTLQTPLLHNNNNNNNNNNNSEVNV